ncbi:serine/threonine-protein phosphatase 7 long form homolog [Phragmites australis]|uniref:serine/threonine-protein phosphatase 7 long form homolog n=1 Tax=Phragmites australis TaxID=29695 RepID=UPI002D797131|nr:serine/threonine-protein phosphatase 7 long form homolog [Phragmites australis]
MAHDGLPELLQQRYDENHRGRMIFTGQQLGPLRARSVHKIKELDPRFHEPLARAGLLPFALMMARAPIEVGGRTPLPAIDEALLTGLVDRWRLETHTFHFPFGEMAVTLRDVTMLTGLPIRGAPLIVSRPAREQWKGYVADRFGVQYDGKDAGLSMSWVHGLIQFGPCPLDADETTLIQHYEVYLYVLLGGIMFCNTAGDYVVPHIVWLAAHLASYPYEPTSYSWGSAVLAATYRGLCDATQRTKRKATITGCLHLLQLWSWEYLPFSRPWVLKCYYPVHISDGIADDIRPTMGYRWIHARLRWSQQQDHGNYSRVISDLDVLSADLVDWDPWRMARVKEIADGGLLASSCSRDADLWLTTCFLLYMNCVEVYSPERV